MTTSTITTARGATLTLTTNGTKIELSGALTGRVDRIEIPYSGQSTIHFTVADGRRGIAMVDGQKSELFAINAAVDAILKAEADRERREFNASAAGRSYRLTKKMNDENSDY